MSTARIHHGHLLKTRFLKWKTIHDRILKTHTHIHHTPLRHTTVNFVNPSLRIGFLLNSQGAREERVRWGSTCDFLLAVRLCGQREAGLLHQPNQLTPRTSGWPMEPYSFLAHPKYCVNNALRCKMIKEQWSQATKKRRKRRRRTRKRDGEGGGGEGPGQKEGI